MQAAVMLLGLLADAREPIALIDRADTIELNHYYNEHGLPVFSQLICWEWCNVSNDYRVRAWRMCEPNQVPDFDRSRGMWCLTWHDAGTLRRVYATHYRQTWTQHDPEMHDRHRRPLRLRADLHKPEKVISDNDDSRRTTGIPDR